MAKLLVIGALALDRPVRLSGVLAPGARLHGATLDGDLRGRLGGGGANAAVALRRAGHDVALAALVARDAEGEAAVAKAAATGLDMRLVGHRPGRSRTTLIFIDPTGERTVMGLDLDRAQAPPPSLPKPSGPPPQGLYVRAPYVGAADWARHCAGPVVVHWPSPGYAGPAQVLAASADDLDAEALADPFAAGRALMGPGLKWVVVTRGSRGVTAHDGQTTLSVDPLPAEVVDATGAGDVFAAGLLDALVAGASMPAALAHACAWGAVAVGLDSSAPLTGTFDAFRPGSP